MLNDYFKNRTVKNVTLIFLLAIAIYAFVEWREQRLERRATMLPQETQLDLSQVSSEGRVEFLIDSNTGRQYVYIDVYTPVEVPKSKEVTYTGKLAGKLTMIVDIYNKYKKSNPDKYKEWNDIELEVVVKNKANEKIYVVTNCFPYQYRETTLGLPLRSTCNLGYIPNGLYAANIKVLTSNIEFKENKSNIIFSYSGVGDYPDFFSSVFDSLLDGFVTEIFDSLLQYFSELIGD
jgi:hypothetical protein